MQPPGLGARGGRHMDVDLASIAGIAVGLHQAQPHFTDGREAWHRMPQPIDGHPSRDGDGGGMQEFGDPRTDERRPQQVAAVQVDNDTSVPGVVVGIKVRAGELCRRC